MESRIGKMEERKLYSPFNVALTEEEYNMVKRLEPLNIVKHFKRDLMTEEEKIETPHKYLYWYIGIGRHTETNKLFAVYQAMYESEEFPSHSIFIRPLKMFYSEVDSTKYPDSKAKYRFEKCKKEDL